MDSLEQMRAAIEALIKKLESPVESQPAKFGGKPSKPEKTGNPIIDKMRSNIDTPEKAMANAESMRAVEEQFNSGGPIPPVSASDLKQFWDARGRMAADMPPRPGVAVGLAVYAAYGFEAAAGDPGELMPIIWRDQLMSALVERGVLREYVRGEEPDEQVFRAAASLPCNKEDLFQAIMPGMLTQFPPEDAAKFREDLLAQGHDITKPGVDGKFIEWLRSNNNR